MEISFGGRSLGFWICVLLLPLAWTRIALWLSVIPPWSGWTAPLAAVTALTATIAHVTACHGCSVNNRRQYARMTVAASLLAIVYAGLFSLGTVKLLDSGRRVIVTWSLVPDMQKMKGEYAYSTEELLQAASTDPDEVFQPVPMAITRLTFVAVWLGLTATTMVSAGRALRLITSRHHQPPDESLNHEPLPPAAEAAARHTLAILLGAWSFPHFPQFEGSSLNASFDRSFRACAQFLRWNWRIAEGDLLLLENPAECAQDVRVQIARFLRERGLSKADLVFYFIGHGFVDRHGTYRLVLHGSSPHDAETALSYPALLDVFKQHAPTLYWHFYIDACFAGQAVAPLVETYCPRGWTLVTAAESQATVRSPQDSLLTTFTAALLNVLTGCESARPELATSGEQLTSRRVFELLKAYLRGNRDSVPQFFSLNKPEGDAADRPLFPNPLSSRTAGNA